MSTKDFVECLLYGMDGELSVVLRNGNVLKNSGFHQDDMANLAFPSTTASVYGTTIDYTKFDFKACNEWAKIASRLLANAAQLKSINKRATLTSSSNPPLSCTTSNTKDNASSAKTSNTPGPEWGGKTSKLTELEKDWLRATKGCFRCRASWVDHESADCTKWPAPGYVVPVPSGWNSSKDVPESARPTSSTTTLSALVTGFRALHLQGDSNSEIDLPESLAQDSDSDTDGIGVRISITFSPEPALLVPQDSPLKPLDLFADVKGPATQLEALNALDEKERDEIIGSAVETLVASVNAKTAEEQEMDVRAARLMREFDGLFPDILPALTADYLAKTTTRHHIKFVDTSKTHNQRGFNLPFASAAFIIPKKDPNANPRWVNDYRGLNGNTVKDRTPLPLPDVVLSDAALAKYWGKIDMANAFFQTPMAEEDIEKTAIKTPWGLFEWTVMPQGLCNALATHQARVNEALRHLIGVCCQAFVDDVIIYSMTLEAHEQNCRAVLKALQDAGLYCHVISCEGIEADPSKIETIKNWAKPSTVTQEDGAFEAINRIVTSLPVLKPVDQESGVPIWLMTDASKVGIGAVLLQGEDWKTAHPCGFWSRQYIAAEKNYPTHEQELLAVVAALKAWRIDLLGVRFRVLTDHDTLKHFQMQATLSKRQARWTETLADYDYKLSYIPGKQNAVADSMSRFSFPKTDEVMAVCRISSASLSNTFLKRLSGGYAEDSFCSQVIKNLSSSPAFKTLDGLLYFEDSRLVIPDIKEVKESLLHDAHNALGHLGPKKTLASLSVPSTGRA
ncbi:hypothetical protein JCM11251_002874 [Rhodosporidiobolus azoricus]